MLPNHIHAIWTLPPDDADYSLRWRLIKTKFSAHFPRAENLSASKQRRHERGIWQRRFYEHTVRDETDLQRCVDYIHFNPVKHGLCGNVRDWAFSSFHRYVRDGWLPLDWGGTKETAVMSFGEWMHNKKLPTACVPHTSYLWITRNFKILKYQALLFNLIKIMKLKESVYLNILKAVWNFRRPLLF